MNDQPAIPATALTLLGTLLLLPAVATAVSDEKLRHVADVDGDAVVGSGELAQ